MNHSGPVGLAFLGVGWLTAAMCFAYLAVAVPLDRLVVAGGSGSARVLALAAIATLPASLGAAGLFRLAAAARIAFSHRTSAVRRLAKRLEPDMTFIGPRYVDGRLVPDLVIGRHGVAVFRELPTDAAVRRFGNHWEIQIEGSWIAFENPLERTVRDAEHVRRALAAEECDYVVRVHAAVVTTAGDLDRLPGCAVVRPEQIESFLAALPAQRTLTADRLRAIADLLSR